MPVLLYHVFDQIAPLAEVPAAERADMQSLECVRLYMVFEIVDCLEHHATALDAAAEYALTSVAPRIEGTEDLIARGVNARHTLAIVVLTFVYNEVGVLASKNVGEVLLSLHALLGTNVLALLPRRVRRGLGDAEV